MRSSSSAARSCCVLPSCLNVVAVVSAPAPAPATSAVAPAPAEPAAPKPRVLICDDETVNIKTLVMQLKRVNHLADSTKVGSEVLGMLAAAGHVPGVSPTLGPDGCAPQPYTMLFLDLHIGPSYVALPLRTLALQLTLRVTLCVACTDSGSVCCLVQ